MGADGQSCSEVCGSVLPGGTGSTGADYPSGLGYVGVTNSVEYPRYQCLPSFLYLNREFTRSFIATTTGVTCSNYNTRLCDNNAVCEDTSPMFQPASQRCYYMSASTYSNCDAKQNGIQRLCPCGRPLTCSENAYYDTTSGTCEQCPSGKFSSVGAVSLSGCGCGIGEEMSSDGVTCRPCDPGTYQDQAGQAVCKFCETGKYSPNTGSTQSSDCVEVTSCAPGNQRLGTFESGFYCVACTPGKYTSTYDQSSCDECPGGTYSSTSRTSVCTDCQPGTYSSVFKDSCIHCGSFMQSPQGSEYCYCNAGYQPHDTNTNQCDPCPAFTTYRDNGNPMLTQTYKPTIGNHDCVACAYSICGDGFVLEDCEYSNAGTCQQCPDGSIRNSETVSTYGPRSCIVCGRGRYEVGHTTCVDCPAGTYEPTGQSSVCTDCAAGKYSTTIAAREESTCLNCPSGTTSSAGSSTCT